MHWSTESSILEKVSWNLFLFFVPNFESWKKHLFLLFLRSLSITDFNNLESRKRNCCFGKKSWFLDPKNQLRTLILKVMYWLLSPLSMLKLPYGWIGVCSINHVTGKMPNSNMPANKLYNTGIRSVLEINNQKIKQHNIIIIIFNFSFQIRCPKTSWAAQI